MVAYDYHDPVMATEVIDFMITEINAPYLDGTLGGAGHSRIILSALGPKGHLTAFDRDPEALERAKTLLADERRVTLIQDRFGNIGQYCQSNSLQGALFDLGVSSRQLDAKERGFSFQSGVALDMRMNSESDITAEDWLAQADENQITKALSKNADLNPARPLARRIKLLMSEGRAVNSDLLREAVDGVLRPRSEERNGLLARLFQAIRMEVNSEIEEIESGLAATVNALRIGGRICVLSYHSVEDRAVKQVFASLERDCICPPEFPVCQCGGKHRQLKKVTRKPLLPKDEEIRRNPRARSAKLRVMERV